MHHYALYKKILIAKSDVGTKTFRVFQKHLQLFT